MRNNSGDRPNRRGMFRGKRRASLKKMSRAISLVRAIAAGDVLQPFGQHETINGSFSGKKSRFALMRIVRNCAPKRQPAAQANQRVRAMVSNTAVVLLRL